MICLRSIAWSNASLTFGLRSSRCSVFFGLELMMKSVWSRPGTSETSKPASFSVLIAVAGTTLIASISWDFSAEIIASSFENIRRPNSSICGFVPVAGFFLNRAIWFFWYLTRLNGPGADHRRVVRERLQVGALVADVLAPDVLRQDEELLELAEHVPRRLLVADDEGVGIGRVRARDVRDQAGRVGGAAARVLDVGVDRPGRVFRR